MADDNIYLLARYRTKLAAWLVGLERTAIYDFTALFGIYSAYNMSLPYSYRTPPKSNGTNSKNKPKKGTSCVRLVLELVFFFGWLFCTGLAGYFVGHTYQLSNPVGCPGEGENVQVSEPGGGQAAGTKGLSKPPCFKREKRLESKQGSDSHNNYISLNAEESGYTVDELKKLWTCSHAEANATLANQQIFPDGNGLEKTKWKSILSVEPKAFFSKYLHQYPADTRASQPVVVFSHRPLEDVEKISEVCKVIDVAVVPDTPGVCVAVTETFHDVASYHMLHADRQEDGTFALTSNSVAGRTLPEEEDYAGARQLLVEFFRHQEDVAAAVKKVQKFPAPKVTVGVLVEDKDEAALFLNAFAYARKTGIAINKFCVFTTSKEVKALLAETGVVVIPLFQLTSAGASVSRKMRRHFLQAWLAFAVSFAQTNMLWQSPGTLWFERPDNIVNENPLVETLWTYKGRNDARAAPFFPSFDFFSVTSAERPVHLMHEIVLHFDLVLAWDSLDAVAAYRLSENNARYGTTSHIMAPHEVLHTELLAHDPTRISNAIKGRAQRLHLQSNRNTQ